jgi:hypothetical protein
VQRVVAPAHIAGQMLDVFICHPSTTVHIIVDLPSMSGHSLVTAVVNCQRSSQSSSLTVIRRCST